MRRVTTLLAAVAFARSAFAAGNDPIACVALSKGVTVPLVSASATGARGWQQRNGIINGYPVILFMDETSYLVRIDLPDDTQISRSGKLQSIVTGGERIIVELDRHGETLVSVVCQPSPSG